jgi:hypothetical protein
MMDLEPFQHRRIEMKQTIFACILLAATLGCATATVQAAEAGSTADFVFTVPVDVSNLPPEVTHISVCCQVSAGGRLVGPGGTCAARRAVSGRAYRGDFVVEYNANPGVDPATATNYNCNAWFHALVDGAQITVNSRTAGSLPLPLSSGDLTVRGDISR